MPPLKPAYRITAVPIGYIRPHERYDPALLREITHSIQSEGKVIDPLLADAGSCMILDGTHRYWALRNLGCSSVPAALYDYLSDEIRIGCWYRCIDRGLDPEGLAGFEEVGREEAIKAVRSRAARLSIIGPKSYLALPRDGFSIFEAYRLLFMFESELRRRGYSITYASEGASLEGEMSGRFGAVLAPPPIKKEEAIYAALTGKLFPLKSTRHITPSRPLGLSIPLEWLLEDPETASARIEARLSEGIFRRAPPCSVIGGRRYEEDVYIYEPRTPTGE